MNGTLKEALRKTASSTGKDWDEKLPVTLMVYVLPLSYMDLLLTWQ